jgi:hypothetical protein
MKINRRSIAAGLTVGLLAGGAGGAIAATTSGSRNASTSWTTTSRTAGGWERYGYGWGNGDNGWRDAGTGAGWGACGSDTNVGGTACGLLARSGRRAAQTYLGLGASQLQSRLQSGKTLAEIASGQGRSVAGLERAIETAAADSVNADSSLSAAQRSSIITNLKRVVDSLVTGTWGSVVGSGYGGPGYGGSGYGGSGYGGSGYGGSGYGGPGYGGSGYGGPGYGGPGYGGPGGPTTGGGW